jgi:hypothetical protein
MLSEIMVKELSVTAGCDAQTQYRLEWYDVQTQ